MLPEDQLDLLTPSLPPPPTVFTPLQFVSSALLLQSLPAFHLLVLFAMAESKQATVLDNVRFFINTVVLQQSVSDLEVPLHLLT